MSALSTNKESSNRPPVRIVVGFSAGSASEQIAQVIAEPLSLCLGRRVFIELRQGKNGATAAREVAAGAGNGETLFVATLGTHALAPGLDDRLGYDPLADFAPVSLLCRAPMLLACHPSLQVESARELIELARARHGELAFASSAVGGAAHVAAELFQELAGVEMRHACYDDTGKLFRDLESGLVPLSFNNLMSILPRCRSGALRPLGITAPERSRVAPDLPTLAEAALPGYEISNWLGLVAPKATPPAVIAELGAAVCAAMESDAVTRPLLAAGVTPCPGTPEAFGQFMSAEIGRWKPVMSRIRLAAERGRR